MVHVLDIFCRDYTTSYSIILVAIKGFCKILGSYEIKTTKQSRQIAKKIYIFEGAHNCGAGLISE